MDVSSTAELRSARVKLTFRSTSGDVIAVEHPRVGRHGHWRAEIPSGAEKVTIVVRAGGRVTRLTKAIEPGRSLALAITLPGNKTGPLPGLFPY